jgi:hypothetical protein
LRFNYCLIFILFSNSISSYLLIKNIMDLAINSKVDGGDRVDGRDESVSGDEVVDSGRKGVSSQVKYVIPAIALIGVGAAACSENTVDFPPGTGGEAATTSVAGSGGIGGTTNVAGHGGIGGVGGGEAGMGGEPVECGGPYEPCDGLDPSSMTFMDLFKCFKLVQVCKDAQTIDQQGSTPDGQSCVTTFPTCMNNMAPDSWAFVAAKNENGGNILFQHTADLDSFEAVCVDDFTEPVTQQQMLTKFSAIGYQSVSDTNGSPNAVALNLPCATQWIGYKIHVAPISP